MRLRFVLAIAFVSLAVSPFAHPLHAAPLGPAALERPARPVVPVAADEQTYDIDLVVGTFRPVHGLPRWPAKICRAAPSNIFMARADAPISPLPSTIPPTRGASSRSPATRRAATGTISTSSASTRCCSIPGSGRWSTASACRGSSPPAECASKSAISRASRSNRFPVSPPTGKAGPMNCNSRPTASPRRCRRSP